jgi:hypothetical protein
MVSEGHCTVVVAVDCWDALFAAVKVAELEWAPQLDVEVALVTWTEAVAFDPRFPKLQLSTPLAIAQVPGPL